MIDQFSFALKQILRGLFHRLAHVGSGARQYDWVYCAVFCKL